MPNFDKSGPRGQGPRSGRGQGKCRKSGPTIGQGQGTGTGRNQDWKDGFGRKGNKGNRRFSKKGSDRRRNTDQ